MSMSDRMYKDVEDDFAREDVYVCPDCGRVAPTGTIYTDKPCGREEVPTHER